MSKTKIIQLFFILFFSININFGQNTDYFKPELPKIIPPSPTAYELGKYGQIPVGLFTGTPNINIPLYTFSTKNLSVPIQLSYSSNGIKVDQLSSNTGLGWSLNAGGVITRIIRDKPDETRIIDGENAIPYLDIEVSGLNNPLAIQYFKFIGENDVDSETDLYMYNFMGKSGKFVINNKGKIILTDQNSLRIDEYVENSNGKLIKGFKITDEFGVIYIFLDTETSITRSSGSVHTTPSLPSITSWYLSRIIHPKGDIIYFTYDDNGYEYVTGISQSFTIPTPTIQMRCPNESSTGIGYTISPEQSNHLKIIGKQLIKISSNKTIEGEVNFTYNIQHPDNSAYKLLSNIKILNNQQYEIENINFNYLSTANNRIFLNEISYKDPHKNYQFQYIDPESFPKRLSKSTDYWGFYNHKNNNNSYRFPNPNSKLLKGLINQNFLYYNIGSNKEIDTVYEKKGMLQKITYPTKGYNTFEYESNTYYGEEKEYPNQTEIYLQNDTADIYGQDVDRDTGVIPFSQIANFTVNVEFNNNACDPNNNTNHNSIVVNINDNSGEDVIILENILTGYNPVGTNSLTVNPDTPNGLAPYYSDFFHFNNTNI